MPRVNQECTRFLAWREKWTLVRLIGGRPVARLKGESDIIYIGIATNIQKRLRSHLNIMAVERNTAFYLQRIQTEVGSVQVGWQIFEEHDTAKSLERNLLARYTEDHVEFPPLNRQESGKKMRIVEELLESLTLGEKQSVLEKLQCSKRS